MTVFTRYFLLQIPGWILALVILILLHRWLGLPVWAVVLLMIAEVVKDFVLYPFLKHAYASGAPGVMERFRGETGITQNELAPSGFVKIRGELWKAETASPGMRIPKGARVRVTDTGRMKLIVVPEEGALTEPPPQG
jgi:membrane-bound ClpP family serine protease